jgi:hypothetical protein
MIKVRSNLPQHIKTLDDAHRKGYNEAMHGPGIADYWPSNSDVQNLECSFVKAWMRGFDEGWKAKHANDNAGCLN